MGVEGLDVAPNDETKDDSSNSNDDDDGSPARESSGYRRARRLAFGLANDYFTGPRPNIMVVTRKLNIGYVEALFIREHIDEDKMNLLLEPMA
jgi:hypothetical protein